MESNPIKLIKAVKELNIGMGTIVDFLATKGFKVEKQPMAKLTGEMYHALQIEFSTDEKWRSAQIVNPDLGIAILNIEKCLAKNDPILDLGKCGLTSKDFDEGTELDLLLRKCSHVTELILSNWYLVYEGPLIFDTYVESLNGGKDNEFTQLPKALPQLKNLKKLICCGTQEYPWRIKDLSRLSILKNIEELDLSYNEIDKLGPILNLKHLKLLNIQGNKIKFLDKIFSLTELRSANFRNNIIVNFPVLKSPSGIRHLDLGENQLTKVRTIEQFKHIADFFLDHNLLNEILDLEPILTFKTSINIKIHDNPIIPSQVKLLPEENHLPYLKEIIGRLKDRSEKVTISYPVKILIFGNHSVGKSSLVNYLTGKEHNGSTHILRLVNYYVSNNNSDNLPNAVIFDFGGQDFYHGLYRAFMSEGALQLIVFTTDTDKNMIGVDIDKIPIINYDRKYWLGQKRYFEGQTANASEFIMVQTFADKNNEAEHHNYGSYRGYTKSFQLSFEQKPSTQNSPDQAYLTAGRSYFKSYLDSRIFHLDEKYEEPAWYADFLQYIFNKLDKTHASVKIEDVLSRYHYKEGSEADAKASLITNLIILHRHGLVLYYDRIADLNEYVWLDPEKLVIHVQNNILNKLSTDSYLYSNRGIVPQASFEKMVNDDKILLLLKEQKVIFLHQPTQDPKDNEYIIPNHLQLFERSDMLSQLFTFGLDNADFYIKFNEFIPFGLINQMICFFGKQPDVKKFWRNQLIFTLEKEVRVIIELDFEKLLIRVKYQCLEHCVFGKDLINEYLFYSIIWLYWDIPLEQIITFSDFANSKLSAAHPDQATAKKISLWDLYKNNASLVPRDIYLSINGEHFIHYQGLFHLEKDEVAIQAFGVENNRINTQKFKTISASDFQAFTPHKINVAKKIFVSYSRADEDYLRDFDAHLISLKQQGLAVFHCQQIELGKDWDDEIKRKLHECDIMVCLVSVSFLNSDYINKIELKHAIDKQKLIIPIIIKPCDWHHSKIGKYQASQQGKIASIDNFEKAHGRIRGNSKEERDAFWAEVVKEFRDKISFNVPALITHEPEKEADKELSGADNDPSTSDIQ